jgi:hypothetical protein
MLLGRVAVAEDFGHQLVLADEQVLGRQEFVRSLPHMR